MKYYLIAGEASGDLHASNLMEKIKDEDPGAQFRFYGGDKMASVGGTLVKHYKELAYMGFIPVITHLPQILKGMRDCKRDIQKWHPDAIILIDYPGFNLKIAEWASATRKRTGWNTKILYYISPKIWAWKEYRIKSIRKNIDCLFSILPFEVSWFAKRNYNVQYVGNPCVDAIHKYLEGRGDIKAEDRSSETEKPVVKKQIAILAGSRKQEIKDNLSLMVRAASNIGNYKLVIAGAPNIEREYYERFIPEGCNTDIIFGRTYDILVESDAALVTSGTATLETAILGIPQVVCYYIGFGKLVSFMRKLILKVPYISLVNLVGEKEIVRELVADQMTVGNVRQSLIDILPGGCQRNRILNDYKEMNRILGSAGASTRAAKNMVKMIGCSR